MMTAPTVVTMPEPATRDEFVEYLRGLAPEGEKVLFGMQKTIDGVEKYVPTEALPLKTPLYVNTGSFLRHCADENGYIRATILNINHCNFLMLDDIGTKSKVPPIEPTWKIETSPGNFQWGYVYAERPTKAEQTVAVKAIAAAGFSDPGAKNPVRWSRIPGSLNKRKNFLARLWEFHPERRFTLPQICEALGVTLDAEEVERSVAQAERSFAKIEDDGGDDVLAWLAKENLVMHPRPTHEGWYEVVCPAAHEHSDGREGAGYLPASRAFKCLHSHGDEWTSPKFLQWVADQGGPVRQPGMRPELLFGKTPAPEVDDTLKISKAFMGEMFKVNGLDAGKFANVLAPVAMGDKGAFFIRFGESFVVEYRSDVGRVRSTGSPCPAFFGNVTDAKTVFATDNWFSAAALHDATGVPVVCVEKWSFGEIVTEDGESVRALHTDLLGVVRPDMKVRIITHAAMDDDHRKQLATFRMLLAEEGVSVKVFTLPDGAPTFGLWAGNRYGERSAWASGDDLTRDMFKGAGAAMQPVPDEELAEAAISYTTDNVERFGKYYLDLTDRGAGSYILSKLGWRSFYYLRDQGEWVQWHNGAWRRIGKEPIGLVNVAAHGYMLRAKALKKQADQMPAGAERDAKTAEAKAFAARANVLGSSTGRSNVLKDLKARPEVGVFSKIFDADPWLLGVKNGVVDLKTGVLREVTKEDMMFRSCRVRYVPGAQHAKIKRFLAEITATDYDGVPVWMGGKGGAYKLDAGRLRWLQRRLGACLAGINLLTALEIVFGIGSNGKSVIAKMIMGALGRVADGGYAMTIPASAVMSHFHGKDADAPSPYLASTFGARVVVMTESKDTDKLNEQLIKNVTGGDEITPRALYKEPMSFIPAFTPVLLTNHLPEITEGGKAMWDRLAPFHLKMRWRRPGSTDASDTLLMEEDRWFGDDAPNDDDAMEAFLAWLVQGMLDYRREGLGEVPTDVALALAEYRRASDMFAVWMSDEGFEFGTEVDNIAFAFVYDSYKNWCFKNGKKPVASNNFSKRFGEAHPQVIAGRSSENGERSRVFFGIRRRV